MVNILGNLQENDGQGDGTDEGSGPFDDGSQA